MTDPAAPTTPEPFNFVRDTDGVLVQDDRHKIGHWLPAWAYHALRSKWQSEAEAGSRLGSTTGNAGLTPSRDVSDGLELRDAPSATRSTPAEPLDEAALRYAFHAAKWCKDGGPGHVMAHDDEDEDGIRARFIDAYEAARTGTVAVNEQGEELDPDD